MKRILSILLAAVLLISVFAFGTSAYGIKEFDEQILNAKFADAEGLKHIYIDKPVCCQAVEEVTKDKDGVIQGKIVRTFDKSGNILTEIAYKDNEGKLELYRKDEIEYDKNGKPVIGRVYIYKDGEWALNSITRFSFDGNTETDIISGMSSGEEILREKEVIITDDKGNVIDKKQYDYNENAWELISTTTNKIEGNRETEESFDYENGEIIGGSKYVAEKSPDGEDFSLWESYDYDTEKKEFVLEEVTKVEFDENGNRKSERIYDGDGVLTDARDYEYTFDKKGNEILATYYNVLEGKVPEYRFETEYDENGNDVLEKVYDYDIENKKWIKTSDYISEYDKSGEKTKTTFIMTFDDEEYVVETTYKNNLSHLSLKKINGKPAANNEDGWKDYYYCESCKKYYSDAEGQNLIYDIEAWKKGEGKLAYKKSPKTSDNDCIVILAVLGFTVIALGSIALKKKVK